MQVLKTFLICVMWTCSGEFIQTLTKWIVIIHNLGLLYSGIMNDKNRFARTALTCYV
jgi:hypothetical protein